MSYSLGQVPDAAALPTDVAPTFLHDAFVPVDRRRGWVAVPTYDMREYVKAQILTAAAGFVVGVSLGALFGNFLAGRQLAPAVTKIVRNTRGKRRTSARRRRRGRPAGGPVTEPGMRVTIEGQSFLVDVLRGTVLVAGTKMGSVYDLGTSFRGIPIGGEVEDYGTLAGAVKHVIRRSEAA